MVVQDPLRRVRRGGRWCYGEVRGERAGRGACCNLEPGDALFGLAEADWQGLAFAADAVEGCRGHGFPRNVRRRGHPAASIVSGGAGRGKRQPGGEAEGRILE